MRTDLTVPSDFTGWKLADVWDLEDQLDDAKELVSAYIDEQIKFLIGEGWTQQAIAVECSRSQPTISKRLKRLELEPAFKTGRPRLIPGNKPEPEPEDAEVVTGEPVTIDIDLAPPPSRSWKRNPAEQIGNIVSRVEGFTTPLGRRRDGETKDQLIDVDAAVEASDIATLREWDEKLTDAIQRLTRLRTGIRGKL